MKLSHRIEVGCARRVNVRALVCLAMACAAHRAFADAYDPSPTYYTNATGNGATLKGQLFTIISTGTTPRSYGDARYAFAILDQDPNNSANILTAYDRSSINGVWNGSSYNREHVWPKSLLNLTSSQVDNSYTGIASDLFELRPTINNTNSARGNLGYGTVHLASQPSTWGVVTANNGSGDYFFPGVADRGDVARTIFYMATRYGQGQTHNISLVNGQPAVYQMGDLETLLHWSYTDEVDTFERRRNQYIYSSSLNPTSYQGNRNPYIDHPEYVWSIFGGAANTSQLSVAAAASNGTSSVNVNLGKVIAGSAFGTQSVTLNKTGATPTTFDVALAGDATSTLSGTRHGFDYNAQSRLFIVGLSGSTATPGAKSGTITFDNTDITAGAATGQGANDGNDAVNVSGTVVAHSNASFSTASSQKSFTLDFGIVAEGKSLDAMSFTVANLAGAGTTTAFTASLDLDSIAGGNGAFSTTLSTPSSIASGSSQSLAASLLATALGSYNSTLNIANSDENIPGATTGTPLQLTLKARIALAGDANLDGLVNFSDLLALSQSYDSTSTVWATGDFTRDGVTNFDDLLALAQNYNTAASANWAMAVASVPEPTLLFVASALGLIAVRRRRR